jgi:NAD(P)H-dependent FMN reductase
MKALVINGSPRGERSNTRRLLGPVVEGMQEGGADVEEVGLCALDVRPCTGCFSCWTATPGECAQDDDVPGLHARMLAADAIVLGFPLYVFGPPATVQAFLERMIPLFEPWLVREGDVTGHPPRYPDWDPAWLVVSNCGFPEQSHFDALRLKLGHMGLSPICMAAGEFLPSMEREPELAEPLAELRTALREAGQELVRDGGPSEALRQRLDRPVIEWAGVTPEEYIQAGNRSFKRAQELAERRRERHQ